MAEKITGAIILLVSVFLARLAGGWNGTVFVIGIIYGLALAFRKTLRNLVRGTPKPLITYGLLVFIGGLFLEIAAYLSNLDRITAGESVYLFSTSFTKDFLIGLPHYAAVAAVWCWVVKRYKISALQQFVLILIFWGIVVDEFSHLFALIAGNVVDFILAGWVIVSGLNWPLLLLEEKLESTFPDRNTNWVRFPIAFFSQIVAFPVLFLASFLVGRFFEA